jgi:hypothetical protein
VQIAKKLREESFTGEPTNTVKWLSEREHCRKPNRNHRWKIIEPQRNINRITKQTKKQIKKPKNQRQSHQSSRTGPETGIGTRKPAS